MYSISGRFTILVADDLLCLGKNNCHQAVRGTARVVRETVSRLLVTAEEGESACKVLQCRFQQEPSEKRS